MFIRLLDDIFGGGGGGGMVVGGLLRGVGVQCTPDISRSLFSK